MDELVKKSIAWKIGIAIVIVAIAYFFGFKYLGTQLFNPIPKPSLAADQKYEAYKTDDFEIQYPHWPVIDPKNLGGNSNIKLAVTNGGCDVVISVATVPQETTFKAYTEKKVADQVAQTKSTIVAQEITDRAASLTADVTINGVTLRSVSHGFLTSKGQSYGIAFVAKKDDFDKVCQPFVDKAVESVRVK